MRCERLQRAMTTRDPEEGAPLLRWRIRQHLRRCEGCRALAGRLSLLDSEVERLRDMVPPPQLEGRIAAALTAGAPAPERAPALSRPDRSRLQRPRESPTMKWKYAAAGMGLLAAALGSYSWSRSAYAQFLKTSAVLKDVKSAHIKTWRLTPEGTAEPGQEMWYENGNWRTAKDGEVKLYAQGKTWQFQPRRGRILFWKSDGLFGHAPSGFTFPSIQEDTRRWGWKERFRTVGVGVVKGRPARKIHIENADRGEEEQVTVWVDALTQLPLLAEQSERTGGDGTWRLKEVTEFRFNQDLPDRLFDPKALSAKAEFVDKDALRRVWEERVARPVARASAGGITFTVRDLSVNAHGDLFLLYSYTAPPAFRPNARNPGVNNVELRDDREGRYLSPRPIVVPSSGGPESSHPPLFPGEALRASWWIRPEHADAGPPREFAFTLKVGGREVQVSVPATQEQAEVLPEWVPYLYDWVPEAVVQPWQHWSAVGERHEVLGRYYREQGHLERALDHYRKVLDARAADAQEGNHWDTSSDWVNVGEVLQAMGRTGEAREAFQTAVDAAVYPASRNSAEAALKRLGPAR